MRSEVASCQGSGASFGTLRVDCTSGKLQVASGKFRNADALIID